MGLPAFNDPELLAQSLTHKSYYNENSKTCRGDNERLEFLGDAVIDLVLSHYLYVTYPRLTEGELSKIRASLVNETVLSEIANELKLGAHLKLGRGETQSGGAGKPRLLASCFEAVVGALYLDQGYAVSNDFLLEKFKPRVASLDTAVYFRADYKTRLQEKLQELHRRTPTYEVVAEEGPDHDKTFKVNIVLDKKVLACGKGKSKKQAEQDAARQVLEELERNGQNGSRP